MNRYALAIGLFTLLSSAALAQNPTPASPQVPMLPPTIPTPPISGAFPPWSPYYPQAPALPPMPPPFPPAPPILQPPPPYYVPVQSGQILRGYYKMDAYLVGGRDFYPYDTGEFNLSGFAGNARYYGVFRVNMPTPEEMEPLNASVYYRSCPGLRLVK